MIRRQLAESLQRLNTSYIDLYYQVRDRVLSRLRRYRAEEYQEVPKTGSQWPVIAPRRREATQAVQLVHVRHWQLSSR